VQALDTAKRLERFKGRGAGSDAERRAALWLADELATSGRDVAVETFWCRPNWALAQAWHAALAMVGSLVMVASPRLGGGLLVAALVFIVFDAFLGVSPGRRLTPERASQNVVARPGEGPQHPIRLILAANYDAARTGIVQRDAIRRPIARLRRVVGPASPGWIGWLAVAVAWLEVMAVLRVGGHHGEAISIAQLPPTIGVILALAALLELASSPWSPSAGDNGSGVGVALDLARALGAAPPRNVDIHLVLTGAADGGGIGLRRFLRAHRTQYTPATTVVIAVAACSAGSPRWWRSDGSLLPLRYARRLVNLAGELAGQESYLGALPHDGRGQTHAFVARLARIPSIVIGCLDDDGLAPRSHRSDDRSAAIDQSALDAAVQFGLMLADAIDAALAPPLSVDAAPDAVGD